MFRLPHADADAAAQAGLVEVPYENALLLQRQFELARIPIEHAAQHEVGLRRIRLQEPQFVQRFTHAFTFGDEFAEIVLQRRKVLQGSDGRQRRGDVDIIRLFDLPQLWQQPFGECAVAYAQASQAS